MTVSFKRDDKQDVSIKLRRQTQIRKSVCTPVLLDKSLTQAEPPRPHSFGACTRPQQLSYMLLDYRITSASRSHRK